ncbi:hypothetical protein ACFX1S_007093 [Malus domestica]
MTPSSLPIREHILDFDDYFERELRRKRKNPKPSESNSNSEATVEFEEEENPRQEWVKWRKPWHKTIVQSRSFRLRDWTMPHLYVFNIPRLPKERSRNSS